MTEEQPLAGTEDARKEEIVAAILQRVLVYLTGDDDPEWMSEVEAMYYPTGDLDYTGCLPDGDDLMNGIMNKFYAVMGAVRDEFQKREPSLMEHLYVHVCPSYEDATHVQVTWEPTGLPVGFVIYQLYDKAWNYKFESQPAFAEHLWQLFDGLRWGYQEAQRIAALTKSNPV